MGHVIKHTLQKLLWGPWLRLLPTNPVLLILTPSPHLMSNTPIVVKFNLVGMVLCIKGGGVEYESKGRGIIPVPQVSAALRSILSEECKPSMSEFTSRTQEFKAASGQHVAAILVHDSKYMPWRY